MYNELLCPPVYTLSLKAKYFHSAKRLHNKKLHDLYASASITGVSKSKTTGWAE